MEVPELPLSADMRHSLYLACKEALNNMVKHAGASEVSVRLDLADSGFTLAIEDDGQGFAAGCPPARGQRTLKYAPAAAKSFTAFAAVESAPGRGTRVVFSLPVAIRQSLPP